MPTLRRFHEPGISIGDPHSREFLVSDEHLKMERPEQNPSLVGLSHRFRWNILKTKNNQSEWLMIRGVPCRPLLFYSRSIVVLAIGVKQFLTVC